MGTRLSAAVCDEVLDRGRTWIAPALVINEWYLTASEPIRDPAGRVIGVLAVGLLQAPFVHRQRVIIGVLLAIVGTAAGASLVLIFFVTAAVLRPIGAIVAMSKRVIAGNLSAAVGAAARPEKWGCSARPSTAWPTPWPSARSGSNASPTASSDAARSWPRSAAWPPAWPMRSTTR